MLSFLQIYFMIKIIRENLEPYSINAKFVLWIHILFFNVPVAFRFVVILWCQYMYDETRSKQSGTIWCRKHSSTESLHINQYIGIKLSEHYAFLGQLSLPHFGKANIFHCFVFVFLGGILLGFLGVFFGVCFFFFLSILFLLNLYGYPH